MTAALVGTSQVIIPHNYDQFNRAYRLQELGAGAYGPLRDDLTIDSLDTLVALLRDALPPELARRAHEVAGRMGRASPLRLPLGAGL